jgi:hypothetical protein
MKLPEHKCGLHLEHNVHKNYYETAESYIRDYGMHVWKDEASKQRAIDTDSIWTLQWYPDTPIGFYAIAAPTLEELLASSSA